MNFPIEANKILGKDWMHYHPYSKTSFIDNYYVSLCNNVLKLIQNSDIAISLVTIKEEKALACMLVCYFEDIVSETHLFSTFTKLHKKMYGKDLPFYELSEYYFDDDINLQDIYFLIWYHISVHNNDTLIDPYVDNTQYFHNTVSKIYDLFDREFEKAPQNEELQNFLQIATEKDVKTIREKLSFIACCSFLWYPVFSLFFSEVVEKYKVDGKVVLDEQTDMKIYDQRINFLFNKHLPLLSLRANEYFAALLGEKHPNYQFLKNISQREYGYFLIRKIESEGFLLEHLTSKKQLFLSNEFTTFDESKLVENETILLPGLVEWEKDIWQLQGTYAIYNLKDLKEKDISAHLFDDENMKIEFTQNYEKAFLEVTQGKRIKYLLGLYEYKDFFLEVSKKYTKNLRPNISDEELNQYYEKLAKETQKNLPFKESDPIGVFFNPNGGMEAYMINLLSCMPDDHNPFYKHYRFNLNDLIIEKTFSVEFVNYVIENKLINLYLKKNYNQKTYNLYMENLDFLLRFYRRAAYFSKPSVTLNS